MRGARPRAVREVAMSEQTQPTNNFMTWTMAVLAPLAWITKLVAGAVLGLIAPILMTLLGLASVLLAFTAVLFHFAAPQAGLPFWEFLSVALACAIARSLIARIFVNVAEKRFQA